MHKAIAQAACEFQENDGLGITGKVAILIFWAFLQETQQSAADETVSSGERRIDLKNRQKRAMAIRMACMLILFCVMCHFVPYTDDDLRWGSAIGAERLENFFVGYGGRYLGYLIIMALTRSAILKTVFMGAVLTLMCFLVREISGYEYADLLAALALFLSSRRMFSQTVGWASGFANYVTSVTFTMIYIAWFLRFLKKKEPKNSAVQAILLALLGLANTLIVEHFTIYNVVLAAVSAVYSYLEFGKRGKRKICLQPLGYLLGCLTGAAWMFSNSVYRNVVEGTDGYRRLNVGSPVKTVLKGIGRISRIGYCSWTFMHGLLFVLFLLFACGNRKELCRGKRRVAFCCAGTEGLMALFSAAVRLRFGSMPGRGLWAVMGTGLCGLSIAALLITSMMLLKVYENFGRILFLVLSIVLVDGPFIVAKPITPRVFFGAYIFLVLIGCILVETLPEKSRRVWRSRTVGMILGLTAVGLCLHDTCIYRQIDRANRQRLEQIRQQVEEGARTVVLSPIEHYGYVHDINAVNNNAVRGYKSFYGLPEDLQILPEKLPEKSDQKAGERGHKL